MPTMEAVYSDLIPHHNIIVKRIIVVRDKHANMDTISIVNNYTGKGTKIWTNAANGIRIYHGDWLNGQMQGHGIAIMFDGTIKMGLWNDNLYVGNSEAITLEEFLSFPEILPLELITENHLKQEVNKWQQKDEFESIESWLLRVNENTRKEFASVQYQLLVDKYTENAASKMSLNLRLGTFDANNGTYIVSDSAMGDMPVALTNKITPPQFKELWNSIIKIPTYYYNGDKIFLWDITFWKGKEQVGYYKRDGQIHYDTVTLDYDFNPINIPLAKVPKGKINIPSDVDINIPYTRREEKESFAFIVANENYNNNVQDVPYALNDGKTFKEYCHKTLGIDESHIKFYPNATYGQLLECVASIKQKSEAYDGEVKIIFYYAGHAFPDESNKNAHLLPVDGNPKIPATSYSLHQLYLELGNLKAKSIVCFIDACFSGATRQDGMLLASRDAAIKAKKENPIGKMVVFTSSSEYETSMMYQEKSHGLFTYFLLKKLKESRGNIELGELADYLIREVKHSSDEVNQKLQTPQVLTSPKMSQQWRHIKL